MRRQRFGYTISTHEMNVEDEQDFQLPPLVPMDGLICDNYQDFQMHSPLYPVFSQPHLHRSYSAISSNSGYSPNFHGFDDPDTYNYSSQLDMELPNAAAKDSSEYVQFTSDNGVDELDLDDGSDASPYCYPMMNSNPMMTFPALSPIGTVFLVLRQCIRVDITADKAVFVTNYPGSCIGVMNDNGDDSCIIHPNGRVLQETNTVHMQSGNMVAKICRRGVVFTASDHSLSYVVDQSGTKSTSDRFKDLSQNIAMNVFFRDNPSRQLEQESLSACYNLIAEASFRSFSNGDEIWLLGGIRIKQNMWGEIRVSTHLNRRILRTSAAINCMSISTPFAFMKISCNPYCHFVVRRGDKTVSAHSDGILVQNGSQKAGFDERGKLKLY